MNTQNHVAIVTGASRGIGQEIAMVLSRKGIAVCVHYHRARGEAEEVAALIKKEGGSAAVLQADVRDREQVENLVARCRETLGPVDILVNNARQIDQKKKFLDLDWNDFLVQIDVIFQGAVHCCQAVVPSMKEKGAGRIINILSTTIAEPDWRWYAYSAAKSALLSLTRNLAAEMGEHGITVNCVSPGFTPTERQTQHSGNYQKEYIENTPLGRFPVPRDTAETVAFLASEEAAFLTGVNLPVSGGRVML